jgi:DnaJ-class molecular chaperone
MNVINVGFNSNHWNILVEGSDEYKNLSIALDNGDDVTARHIMNTVMSLITGDYNNAYREAHNAIKASEGNPPTKDKTVRCPFCRGDGVIEFEDIPTRGGYRDPTDAVDAEASCDACGGDGSIDASKLLDTYAEGSYSEHVVMSVIKGDMTQAKELANAVMSEIMSHADDNFEKSTEGVGE